MCGIVGYIGERSAADILLDGLMRLEYRGYDSAGIATLNVMSDGPVETFLRRSSGKLARLRALVAQEPCPGLVGIGHTRWATHGKPTDENAHPHRVGTITVVHNGIIENQYELRERIQKTGRNFLSDTDTEIIAHLIDIARNEQKLPFREAVLLALKDLRGAFSLAIIDESDPSKLICVKHATPLVIGIGDGETFVASDFSALLAYTKRFIILEDGQIGEIRKDGVQLYDFDGKAIDSVVTVLNWSAQMAEKEGHKHFMHKEIFEQPRALVDTLRGRFSFSKRQFDLDDVNIEHLEGIDRIFIVACGSSYYAGMIGKYVIEQQARIPVELDLASEFRYRDAIIDPHTLVLGISQSGETADTLAALTYASQKGAKLLSICNVVGSAIPRLCKAFGGTLYTRAGPEISVASTKGFIAQLMALDILALYLAKNVSLIDELTHVPTVVEDYLVHEHQLRDIANQFMHCTSMLFIGRGVGFPIALEGALKMKELSYVHAEGFAAGELKHGAIALIDDQVPVVAIVLAGAHFEKMLSNMQEVKARGGKLIAVTDEPCAQLTELCEHVIVIPKTSQILSPIVATIPLQLLAYHLADLKGLDVDQPRNLAKSVTVE
jgi:glucosamine--fructose-6-phosphate aminotransferase (isomerizing)